MFRFNNPDALLVLLLTLGAYATRAGASRTAAPRGSSLPASLVGFGFLTKMLQALLVVPAFALAYLVAGAAGLLAARRRPAVAARRDGRRGRLVGRRSSSCARRAASVHRRLADNSFLELTFGYNGLGRLTGNETGSVGGGRRRNGGRCSGARPASRGCSTARFGGQIAWLLPAALVLLVAGARVACGRPRTDRPGAPSLLSWGGWLRRHRAGLQPHGRASSTTTTPSPSPRRSARWSASAVAAVAPPRAVRPGRPRRHRRGDGACGRRAAARRASTGTRGCSDARPGRSASARRRARSLLRRAERQRPAGRPSRCALRRQPRRPGRVDAPDGRHRPHRLDPDRRPDRRQRHRARRPRRRFGGCAAARVARGRPPAAPAGGSTADRPADAGGSDRRGGPPTAPARRRMGGCSAATRRRSWSALLRGRPDYYRGSPRPSAPTTPPATSWPPSEPVMPIGGFNGTDPSPTLAQFQQYVADGDDPLFIAGGAQRAGSQRRQPDLVRRSPRWVEPRTSQRPPSAASRSTTCRRG